MNRLAFVLLLAVIFTGCGDPEPIYNDKSLSEWIKQLDSEDEDKILEAIQALGAIGPDAHPARMKLIALGSYYAAEFNNNFSAIASTAIALALKEIDKPFTAEKKDR